VDVENRWKRHIGDAKRTSGKTALTKKFAIQNAVAKYGENNFTWQIIDQLNTIDEANEAEEFYISYLETLSPNGYNLIPGGANHHPTIMVKQKISDKLKITSFFIGKQGSNHPNYGRQLTNEIKVKQRAKLSGNNGPNKKINSDIAKDIYIKYLNNITLTAKDLANEYNLSHVTVLNILNKRSWKDVLKDLPQIIMRQGAKRGNK